MLFLSSAYGQRKPTIPPPDSARAVSDTISKDSLNVKTKKDIETTIKYSAKDSIRMDVVQQIVYLYGQAKINYGDINLESDKIEINWASNTLTAYGGLDTVGKTIGIPVFKQGSETYTSEVIKYNFKTKKGLISKLVTKQGEGFIHGETVKRKDDQMFVSHARYTTCNLAHPHFYINATKLKLIPDDKIVSGPFNLVISDVPTPLGFFLGLFPVPKKNKSGLIFPAYGENQTRGFFLSRLGYYWAVNDYIGVTATTDLYSKGTYGLQFQTNYTKRYSYSGAFFFNVFNVRDNSDETFQKSNSYRLTWTHSSNQVGRSSSLSASVNLASNKFYKGYSYNSSTRNANDFNSTVNFRKTFTGTPFSLNVNLSQSQNVNYNLMNVTFPELFFAMNRITPFKKKNGMGKSWYEQIGISYNFNSKFSLDNSFQIYDPITNQYVRNPTGASLSGRNALQNIIKGGQYYLYGDTISNDPYLRERPGKKILVNGAQYGARHTIPISTSIKLFKNFSLSPAINYTEFWYPKKEISRIIKASSGRDSIISYTDNGFSRSFGWSTGGTNLRTNIYGTYVFKKSKLMGIRHIITPSISYSYSPDLTKPFYGGYQNIYDEEGRQVFDNTTKKPLRVSHYSKYGQLYGSPGGVESSRVTFNLQNAIEAKTRNAKDTANPVKKFKLLDNLSLNTSYDFLATQFKWSDLSFNARTNILNGKIVLNYSSTYTLYQLKRDTLKDKFSNYKYNRIDQMNIPRFMNGYLSLDIRLNPKANKSAPKNNNLSQRDQDHLNYIHNNPEEYIDFKIPWNLNISYNVNFYSQYSVYNMNRFKGNINANNINLTGDLSLTENTKITFNTNYDLVGKMLPAATMGIVRDLHCWQMAMNVFYFQDIGYSYLFSINAKSSLLQDLKLDKRSPNMITPGF